MTFPIITFLLLYWPCIRLGQVLHRVSKGKPLGNETGTVISMDWISDIIYWAFYISVAVAVL